MNHPTDQGVIPADILDDLSSRFIINIPEGERTDPIRLFFQIELAHWYYLDFHRTENPKLRSCGMKEFTKLILRHIPSFSSMLSSIDMYYDNWKEYKMSVPTYGAILLNKDLTKVLLVQSFFERTSWGFPKGKVNEDEDPVKCAAREVLEETGCDISALIRPDDFLEASLMEQRVRLYVVPGLEETTHFCPQTRNEIKNVEWFVINDLPTNKKDTTPKLKTGVRANSFFMVLPFVRRIKNWVLDKRGEDGSLSKRKQRHRSLGDAGVFLPSSPSTSYDLPPPQPQPLLGPNVLPKNKRQLQVDKTNRSLSEQKTTKLAGKEPKTPITLIRRQLFRSEAGVAEPAKHDVPSFLIPSWLNFKLDRGPLLKCFDI